MEDHAANINNLRSALGTIGELRARLAGEEGKNPTLTVTGQEAARITQDIQWAVEQARQEEKDAAWNRVKEITSDRGEADEVRKDAQEALQDWSTNAKGWSGRSGGCGRRGTALTQAGSRACSRTRRMHR